MRKLAIQPGLWVLLLALAASGWSAGKLAVMPLVDSPAASRALCAQALAAGRCYAEETDSGTPGTLCKGATAPNAVLPAGRYRLHVLLARAPLGDSYGNAVTVTIEVAGASYPVLVQRFPQAHEFVDCPVDFTLKEAGRAVCTVSWAVPAAARTVHKIAARNPDDPDDHGEDIPTGGTLMARDDGTCAIADVAKAPYHLAATGMHVG